MEVQAKCELQTAFVVQLHHSAVNIPYVLCLSFRFVRFSFPTASNTLLPISGPFSALLRAANFCWIAFDVCVFVVFWLLRPFSFWIFYGGPRHSMCTVAISQAFCHHEFARENAHKWCARTHTHTHSTPSSLIYTRHSSLVVANAITVIGIIIIVICISHLRRTYQHIVLASVTTFETT